MIRGVHAVEDVRGAHDIGPEGFLRLLVGAADERLRGEMEDDARARGGEGGADGFRIADVGNHVIEALGQSELAEERRIGIGLEGEAVNFGAEQEQPFAEPTALESGVPGDKDGKPRESAAKTFQNDVW